MRLILSLSAAAAAAILFLGCGSTEEVSQNDLQALASSPAVATPTATPTPAPTLTASPTLAPTDTPVPTTSPAPPATLTYTDTEYGFSLQYPAFWTVSEPSVLPDEAALDKLKEIEFTGKGGLARARVFIFQNPANLSLEDWILEHNSPFFDTLPQQIVVGGLTGLLQPLSFEGLPSPRAYLDGGTVIINFGGLTPEDYDIIQGTLQFD